MHMLSDSDTQPTVLPLELYELIIDSLAEDDDTELTTIRTCSFVSRTFLPLTRKHIFASVVINNPSAKEYCPSPSTEAFVSLIERSTEIGEYIRKIEYCMANDDDDITFPTPRMYILGKRLTNLNSLGIWTGDAWKTQKWFMRPVLLRLMQLPSLSNLRFHWIKNFPAFHLIHSTGLKHLAIEYTDFSEDVVPPSTAPLPRKLVYLHEYTVGPRCASATKKLTETRHPDGLPIVDFTKLAKVIANCYNEEDIDAFQTILIRANQLQNIDLTSKPPPLICEAQLTIIDLVSGSLTYAGLAEMVMGSIRTLKTLTLTATVYDSSKDPLSRLCGELGTISATGRSVIETLSIDVSLSTDVAGKRGNEWGLLDSVLTKKDTWLGLKEVSLNIRVYFRGRDKEDDSIEPLNKLRDTQFKGLSASEKINFKFEVMAVG